VRDWKYEPAQDLDQSLVERLKNFPRQPDMLVYGLRALAAFSIRLWLRAYHRFRVTGREHLPVDGSFVMVANHSSHLDALCLLSALPLNRLHRAFPAAAADYFFESVPRIWIAAVVVNALPFSREVRVRQSLALCEGLLKNPGNVLVLFPEGTRSVTGDLGRFKPGIGALLNGQNAPVIPCYLNGAFRAWPKGKLWPRPHRISLHIGPPRNYGHLPPGKESACAIATDLHATISQMKPTL
jgi:1-acyl-sn-glycerol-3-phosphate acyltransferase